MSSQSSTSEPDRSPPPWREETAREWPAGGGSAGPVKEMARSHLAFLAETSACLAGSLDYESTLRTVAGLALPFLGSWCIVDLVEPDDGSMRRVAIVHPDPAMQELVDGLAQSWPPGRDDALGAPRAVRSRQVEVIPCVDDEMLVAVARDEDNLRTLRALGIASVIVVPLIARGQVLGALTLVSAEPGAPYAPDDLAVAMDLGSRCALAIDNARLHRQASEASALAARMNERLVVSSIHEQELAEQAQQANQAKSLFLSAMSHELRTPINSVIGYTDLLELEIAGPLVQAQREYLARIRASSRHLVELVTDVLDLAKVEAGRMRLKDEQAQAARVIEEAAGVVAPQAGAGGVTLQHGGDGWYLGDEDRVRQILVNLLANAVKFTAPGGRVGITCGTTEAPDAEARVEGDGPWTFVRVEDTGTGIAAQLLDSVFEPFVQGEQGHTRKHGGTGLGLTISRELARLMGGDLTLRSVVGEGSCFTLWLRSASWTRTNGGRRTTSP